MRRAPKRHRETTPSVTDADTFRKRKISDDTPPKHCHDFFDPFPDDIVILILSKLSSSAASPRDLSGVLLTCKRLNELAGNREVLSRASRAAMVMPAEKWSESSHRFLIKCCDAGNLDACYFLGMIRFYCLQNRAAGAALMARAALGAHAAAAYSLAIIRFNGSGGTTSSKRPRAGFILTARSALLGHVDAIRELGYCFIDGHGVPACAPLGHRYLLTSNFRRALVPGQNQDPVHRFIREWHALSLGEENGLRICCNEECGRRESRKHEFRRCAVCTSVNYCSRSCQASDWSAGHRDDCREVDLWDFGGDVAAGLDSNGVE